LRYKIKEVKKPAVEKTSAPGNEQIQLKCPTHLQKFLLQINSYRCSQCRSIRNIIGQYVRFKMPIKTFPSSYCHLHTRWTLTATKHELARRARRRNGASTVIGAGKYVSKIKIDLFCKKIA
jgi:hypothetical protein